MNLNVKVILIRTSREFEGYDTGRSKYSQLACIGMLKLLRKRAEGCVIEKGDQKKKTIRTGKDEINGLV